MPVPRAEESFPKSLFRDKKIDFFRQMDIIKNSWQVHSMDSRQIAENNLRQERQRRKRVILRNYPERGTVCWKSLIADGR